MVLLILRGGEESTDMVGMKNWGSGVRPGSGSESRARSRARAVREEPREATGTVGRKGDRMMICSSSSAARWMKSWRLSCEPRILPGS